MDDVAYRFVPCKPDGAPSERSELALLTSDRLEVGSIVEFDLGGFSRWEVLGLSRDAGPLLGVTDAAGKGLTVAGTLFCRGVPD